MVALFWLFLLATRYVHMENRFFSLPPSPFFFFFFYVFVWDTRTLAHPLFSCLCSLYTYSLVHSIVGMVLAFIIRMLKLWRITTTLATTIVRVKETKDWNGYGKHTLACSLSLFLLRSIKISNFVPYSAQTKTETERHTSTHKHKITSRKNQHYICLNWSPCSVHTFS